MKAFDLHCDTLCALHGSWREIAESGPQFNIERLPRNRCGCQTFAVFVPDTLHGTAARAYFDSVCGYAQDYFAAHNDRLLPVQDTAGIDAAVQTGRLGAMLSVENAAALGGDPAAVAEFAACGVRLMTLTWNAENELGGGVQSDAGLTDLGREVLSRMEGSGITLDVSHLNDITFRQAAAAATRPFIASHSNSRTCCGNRRNLTDAQFAAVAESGGIVGMNFCVPFLTENGKARIDDLLRHIDHFLALGGEHILALGSDFDGTDMPDFVLNAAALDFVYESMVKSSLGRILTDDIFFNNAYTFFKTTEDQT